MSTDDNHTPAHLSAARLAEIRAVATAAPADLYAEPDPGATCDECGEYIGGEGAAILRTPGGGGELIVLSGDNDAATLAFHREARAMALELLSHLDALTPRAPVDGGRLLYYALHPTAHERAWEAHDADLRARYDAQAESLDATGYVRGLYAAHRLSAQDIAEQSATIARLTAERDAARSEARASAAAMLAPKIELATMGLRAELAEVRAAVDALEDDIRAADLLNVAAEKAARLDGAREERTRLIAHYEGLGRTGIVSELRKLDSSARGEGGER